VRYTLAGLALSALATFFAGLSSLAGKPLVVDDWRVTCAVAAVFTLGATIATGVQSQLAKPDLLTQASECVGKLRALMSDTLSPTFDGEDARKKYQQILVDYSGVDL
jgi:predicted cupin superfamily sugar epimerase